MTSRTKTGNERNRKTKIKNKKRILLTKESKGFFFAFPFEMHEMLSGAFFSLSIDNNHFIMHNTKLYKWINALGTYIRLLNAYKKSIQCRNLDTSWIWRDWCGLERSSSSLMHNKREGKKMYDKFTEKETINFKLYTLRVFFSRLSHKKSSTLTLSCFFSSCCLN